MRKILFRGKRIDNGEWVEGQTIVVIHQDDNDLLFMPQQGEDVKADPMDGNDRALTSIYGNYYQILPQTVGQYIGLTDKNGNEIFEGDILQVKEHGGTGMKTCAIYFGEYIDADSDFEDYRCIGFYLKVFDECFSIGVLLDSDFEFEIIGNIHDNPELLEVDT